MSDEYKPLGGSQPLEFGIVGLLICCVAGGILAAWHFAFRVPPTPPINRNAPLPHELAERRAAEAEGEKVPEQKIEPLEGAYEDHHAKVLELEKEAEFGDALFLAQRMRITYPERLGELKPLLRRLRKERLDGALIHGRITQLGAENDAVVEETRKRFLEADEAGRIVLRRYLRYKTSGNIALQAARLLAEMGDPSAPEMLLRILERRPPPKPARQVVQSLQTLSRNLQPELVPRLLTLARSEKKVHFAEEIEELAKARTIHLADDEKGRVVLNRWLTEGPEAMQPEAAHALSIHVDELDPAYLAGLYDRVAQDKTYAERFAASVVLAALETRCEGKAEALDTLLDRKNAFATLKTYVKEGTYKVGVVNRWAGQYAAMFGLLQKGVRGQYFSGTEFNKLEHTQIDKKIDIPDRKYPFPDKRSENLSIRWTGKLMIEKAGKYTFYSASDDGHRLWIDGKLIIDDWTGHGVQEVRGTIELEPGMVDFKHEHFQGGGGGEIHLYWSGPGFKKKLITDAVLRTQP